ncbi:MAG: ImmA/IrrE family metallo-endopeptidase, partial [Spirochaetes bacterium]|nr:ImmA/IrrE family metallo-endopeptidase [Candidatus Ornithospirochaeta stercoravium]
PIQAAQFIRKKWNIGNDAIVSTSSLLEKKGIKVIFLNAHADFDGMSGYVNHEKPIIILNGNNNSERIRFSAMHELGHLILGNAYTKASVNETRCHEFASEMLIPSEAFIFIIGKKRKEITINELISIQEQYGISISALMRKALNLKIITKYDYDKYKGRYNNDPEFRLTCDESRFSEYRSEKFENMVYRALSEGLISESKASALLKKDVAEIRNNIW